MVLSTQPTRYTIIIAKQKGEYFIYPGSTSSWRLNPGDKILFSNTTNQKVRVRVKPTGYLVETFFDIGGSDQKDKAVDSMKSVKDPLTFKFFIFDSDGNEVFVASGGPKMVPTDPQF